ncbi:hypothetical protein KIN20_004520 [Parelaphostrongylus tenuis]|uniref:Uncharacterized protein n=1 Tax=Parelaphostrongylus tenuis TaxID=148309 RepID=A0AAD5QGW6_PARTN|nr:hypothetical protein KIN20_004520 [Parelaphostrongylus tenuis]
MWINASFATFAAYASALSYDQERSRERAGTSLRSLPKRASTESGAVSKGLT